ncbi:uncharacterized protein VNE69_12118 [Vairimorpha necatrix]|uniref:Uncharacterized protein n=1 Tax=Vairimorpha necatrix TaxID=6039 RepID=A0AAX4JGL5_9MICR
MFFVYLILNNMQQVKGIGNQPTTSKEDFTNEELKKCTNILFQPDTEILYYRNDIYEVRTLAKIIHEAILNKMSFPMKSQYNWPVAEDMKDYEILREDIKFSSYWKYLYTWPEKKVRKGKEAVIFVIFESIMEHSQSFYRTLKCINSKVQKINNEKLIKIVDKYVDLKMNDYYNFKIMRVFNPKDYKNIAEEINDSFREYKIPTRKEFDINSEYNRMNMTLKSNTGFSNLSRLK